ncbi:MAG: orotate phosphoribosyltransferase [Bacillota bacterium]|jgi:orotate phosphoribosyltransferase
MAPMSAEDRRIRMAQILIEIGAVGARPEEPFTLTSGTKSPVYIDVRRLISFVEEREEALDMLAALVSETVKEKVDAVAGGETAGIPYAAFLSSKMRLPMLYVRKKPKGFGRNAQVEGYLDEGKRVVLVEDLMFDGGSKVNFVQGLRNAGFKVGHVFTVASYGFSEEYERTLGAIGVQARWLTDWPAIVEVGEKKGFFGAAAANLIREFLKDPHAWSQARGGK